MLKWEQNVIDYFMKVNDPNMGENAIDYFMKVNDLIGSFEYFSVCTTLC